MLFFLPLTSLTRFDLDTTAYFPHINQTPAAQSISYEIPLALCVGEGKLLSFETGIRLSERGEGRWMACHAGLPDRIDEASES